MLACSVLWRPLALGEHRRSDRSMHPVGRLIAFAFASALRHVRGVTCLDTSVLALPGPLALVMVNACMIYDITREVKSADSARQATCNAH